MEKQTFVEQVLNAHKRLIADAWIKWLEVPKKKAKAKYPDGFKDFLIEFIDALIKDNQDQLST